MTEEIAVYETKEVSRTTPAMLLNLAIEKNADIDKLEKLMDLQIKWQSLEAKKAYTQAMSNFKANPPEIDKNKHVSFGQTEYNHASLANVTDKINAGLSEHGLSASWTNFQVEGSISVTCRITHVMGHSEETTLTSSPDTSGSKNSIQAIGSAITYLQRYTLMALTGLAARDMDDDGNAAESLCITEEQAKTIEKLIDQKKADKGKFLKYLGAESIDKITAGKFDTACSALRMKADPEREPGE